MVCFGTCRVGAYPKFEKTGRAQIEENERISDTDFGDRPILEFTFIEDTVLFPLETIANDRLCDRRGKITRRLEPAKHLTWTGKYRVAEAHAKRCRPVCDRDKSKIGDRAECDGKTSDSFWIEVHGFTSIEVTFGRTHDLINVTVLKLGERCTANARFWLCQPLPSDPWILDDLHDPWHSLNRTSVDQLCQREDVLSLALQKTDDRSALLPVMQCRTLSPEHFFKFAWTRHWTCPVFKSAWRRKGRKLSPSLLYVQQ